jgi:hypothetical protein
MAAAPEPEHPTDSYTDAVGDLAAGRVSAGALAGLTKALAVSARAAGARAVGSGRWLAGVVTDVAPRIPVRSLDLLVAQNGGLTGHPLAEALITKASRTSAAIGAAAGAIIGAEELLPPSWVIMPIELAAETLAIAAVEMKLIAELQEVYGRPVSGTPSQRGMAIVVAWAERRGVTPMAFATPGGLAEALGRGTREHFTRLLRRRLLGRMGRNLTSLAPLLAGAAAGAELNRRATRSFGEAVAKDITTAPS